MASQANGHAHLTGDIDFIETPPAPKETLATGKACGVRITDVRNHNEKVVYGQ